MVLRLSLRALLAVACVAGAAACAIAYVSAIRLQDALHRSLGSTDYARALREVRASDSFLNPTAHREGAIALALLESGRPAAAERVIAKAVRREPKNVEVLALFTRIQLTRGELAAARQSWARTRRLDPHLQAALPRSVGLRPNP